MTRLYVALLEPDSLPAIPETVQPADEVQSDIPRPFVRPSLPPVTRQPVDVMSQEDTSVHRLVRFGIIVESFETKIVSEVVKDVLNLVGSLPPGSRLVLVSPNSDPFWDRLKSTVPVDVQTGGFELVPVWKTYWMNQKPIPPKGVVPKFDKFLGEVRKKFALKPGVPSPMPVNPDANRMLPLQNNPQFHRQPSRGPVSMTPQLYMWSSRSPKAGEKVLDPKTEEVESIVSVDAAGMAKIGSDHRMLNMQGFEFFQPLTLWAPRSYKKDDDGSKD